MKAPSGRGPANDGVWLALVPVGVALVLGLLLAPRRPAPEGVPLPLADARELARTAAQDRALAERARHEPLPGAVRALGSALRAFHTLEAADADARALSGARRQVDAALIDALAGSAGPLRELRAVQLEGFLEETRRFEQTGGQSPELRALAGAFVRSMQNEGWCDGRRLAPSAPVLSVMFKQMWNAFLGLESREGLALTLDEQRLLYAFYLSHPHPSKAMRDAIAAARRGAHDRRACDALVVAERAALESWRLDRIDRLASIDPSYPADYARGIASFHRGDYRGSAASFQRWLDRHPEGPFAARAQSFLRASVEAGLSP